MLRRYLPAVVLAAVLALPSPATATEGALTLLVTTASSGAVGVLAGVDGVRGVDRIADRVHQVVVDAGDAPAVATMLRTVDGVIAVEANGSMVPLAVPEDPRYEEQWSHELTGIEAAWDVTTGDDAIGVAVLDTGIQGEHPDLVANLAQQVDATRATVATRTLGTNNDTCGLGHGTAVAGVAGAGGNNGRDIAGAAWGVSLIDVAVVGSATGCRMTDASLVTGLGWAADQPSVDVINISFGRRAAACPTAVQAAIDDAVGAGKVVIAAAGNQRDSSSAVATVPAACRGVIAVGAVDIEGAPAPYSSTGPWVDLVAPGGDDADGILTLSDDLTTTTVSGTSFAAAYVSGVVGLLLSADSDASVARVERALLGTAADVDPDGRDDVTGFGMVDPAAALDAITDGPLPDEIEPTTFPVANHGPARIAGAGDLISQAIAVSKAAFLADDASHAVVARADDYADALAGSTLAAGWGPVLLTNRTGGLPDNVQVELGRVLPAGATVYLLGGTAALPAGLEAQLQFMGFAPERLAGTTREATAAAIAAEVQARATELGAPKATAAIVTTARNWPDAAVASSLAAVLGAPVLVTPPEFLHEAAADALSTVRPSTLYIVGGTASIDGATADAARRAAGVAPSSTVRLAGIDRVGTAVQVAAETEAALRELSGSGPSVVVGVNVRRSNGFGFILTAAPVVGVLGGVFVPIDGEGGTTITDEAVRYACGIGGRAVAIGGTDALAQAAADRLAAVAAASDPACSA